MSFPQDDIWAVAYSYSLDDRSRMYGVSSFRFRSLDGLVHRGLETSRRYGTMCGISLPKPIQPVDDDSEVTCLACISEGG